MFCACKNRYGVFLPPFSTVKLLPRAASPFPLLVIPRVFVNPYIFETILLEDAHILSTAVGIWGTFKIPGSALACKLILTLWANCGTQLPCSSGDAHWLKKHICHSESFKEKRP